MMDKTQKQNKPYSKNTIGKQQVSNKKNENEKKPREETFEDYNGSCEKWQKQKNTSNINRQHQNINNKSVHKS